MAELHIVENQQSCSQPCHLPPLSSGDVLIWSVSLSHAKLDSQYLHSLLSSDEHTRAERYHFARDSERFIARRGLLRTILGRYTDTEPSAVRFCYGLTGKPSLDTRFHSQALHFNLSHSQDLVLYALSWGRLVGIDVENIRPLRQVDHIVERFFSAQESDMIRSLPVEQRLQAFYICWTCKEAYLKATGQGLTQALAQIQISLPSDQTAQPRIVSICGDRRVAARWQLITLRLDPGYVATLATESNDD